jgi:hypothetical protein
MDGGSSKTSASRATTFSAKPPQPVRPITRAPGATRVTPSPTASTVPATSMPGLKGKAGFS